MNPENVSSSASADAHRGVFVTTRWSVVLRAGRSDTHHSRAALEQLCRAYWHPLYHYVRHRGYRPEDAQDLTQGFFERLLERESLAHADPKRGRFRSFLLTSLKNFLSDEWDKASARKRGGGRPVLSLDFETEERRLTVETADPLTPEKVFDQRWATALLDQVYRRLETDFASQGKTDQFAALRVTLTAPRGTTPYAELAGRLGISEGAVKVAVHRLRQRYRELLRETIADTVATPEEVDDELRHLMQALAS